jgi:hypothetical protein
LGRNVFTTSDEHLKSNLTDLLKEAGTLKELIARLEGTMYGADSNKKFQWLRHMDVSGDYRKMTYTGVLPNSNSVYNYSAPVTTASPVTALSPMSLL